jgi:hypothetical protein
MTQARLIPMRRVLRPVSYFLRPVSYFFKKKLANFFFVELNLPCNEVPERGGRDELKLESQEGQELSAGAPPSQLVLNMRSEDQTVDHTNMLMGNDHDTIFIDFSEYIGNSDQRVNDCAQTSY